MPNRIFADETGRLWTVTYSGTISGVAGLPVLGVTGRPPSYVLAFDALDGKESRLTTGGVHAAWAEATEDELRGWLSEGRVIWVHGQSAPDE